MGLETLAGVFYFFFFLFGAAREDRARVNRARRLGHGHVPAAKPRTLAFSALRPLETRPVF